MSEYQGWTNYETWNVALWIDNDRGAYDMAWEWAADAWEAAEKPEGYHHSLTRGDHARRILADQIQELVEDGNPLASDASMYSDMLAAAISEVNWSEIAKGWIEGSGEGGGDNMTPLNLQLQIEELEQEKAELLEALKTTVFHLMGKARRDPDEREVIEQMRDAIAKAEA